MEETPDQYFRRPQDRQCSVAHLVYALPLCKEFSAGIWLLMSRRNILASPVYGPWSKSRGHQVLP